MQQKVAAPVIGSYALLKKIRSDEAGTLYLAQHTQKNSSHWILVFSPFISSAENFTVRLELLKTFLPKIQHPHILSVSDIGIQDNLAYLVKEIPNSETPTTDSTLQSYNPRDSGNRHKSYELLFDGIVQALQYLSNLKTPYHQDCLLQDLLCPKKIFLSFEKSLVGNLHLPHPKLDGIAESFLFFGDSAPSSLQYRLLPSLHSIRQQKTISGEERNPHFSPYTEEAYFSPETRWEEKVNSQHLLHSLGSLIYKTLTRHSGLGNLPPIQQLDPTLDPIWQEIISLCLTQPSSTPAQLSQVQDLIKKLIEKRKQLSPEERKLQKLDIPEKMTLVAVDEKVLLGANDGPSHEQPSFLAKIRPFLIDCTPITVEQYQKFMPQYKGSTYARKPHHPATLISWHMAKAYCQWRSEQEGLPPGTYRLPSEYEWELAARGSEGDLYPWGKTMNSQLLHAGLSKNHGAADVKKFPSSRFGIYDLLGNCWEWTESRYKPHPFSTHQEKGYLEKVYVVKGGCWFSPIETCRASMRAAFAPHDRRAYIGFRCVRSID